MTIISTYDPKDTTVIVDGVHITGLGEDMVNIDKDEENFSTTVGAQGDVVRNVVNNPLHTISLTVQRTSPQVAFLDGLARSGKLVPISVVHYGTPKETNVSTQAFIKKPAPRGYAKEAGEREYDIQALDMLQT